MKFLTILDYSNIVALLLSTVLVLSLKFAGWESPYMMAFMILMLVLVVVNRIKNGKYRRQVKETQHVTLTEPDRRFGYISIAVMLMLFLSILLFPALR